MLGQVGNGGFLELGDADPAVAGFDDFRFDALNLDDFARQGEFDRLALAFAQNAQADRCFGLAAHFLDGIGQAHAFDQSVVELENQVAGFDAGAISRRILDW